MATPIIPLSEEQASWKQWDENVPCVWPEVVAPSPLPMPELPTLIEEEARVELSWRELQARTDARYNRQRRPSKL
ncbi:uncharacterized protein FMAN_08844 [Fusarium mangiferae]|uniref:Uncharacterized protein n=1 Tax=Fusarium mangiferae TaxID=192010 RepID=A0A1L7T2U4_FUSMA|nr:uncharacterized protein FMAN_08844 [Fusarium mangiferae]CVK90483.1 uncharacterized protein FMAN_08844 [Fusarium mangiferae]